MEIVKAERATVTFCEGVSVDGYQLPDGEFRVGKTGSAVCVGFASNYLTGLEEKSTKQLKALQDSGFTGLAVPVRLDSIKGGGTKAETISLQDFRKLIVFAAKKGKPQAEALLNALLDVGLEDWFRLSFGKRSLTLEEKREKFYQSYAQTINWPLEDRHDWHVILEQELLLENP